MFALAVFLALWMGINELVQPYVALKLTSCPIDSTTYCRK